MRIRDKMFPEGSKTRNVLRNINLILHGKKIEKVKDGYVNYVKGANVAGFMKVAKAMMAQGIL